MGDDCSDLLTADYTIWSDGSNGCQAYGAVGNENWCHDFGFHDYNGQGSAEEMCCVCGGGTTRALVAQESGSHGVSVLVLIVVAIFLSCIGCYACRRCVMKSRLRRGERALASEVQGNESDLGLLLPGN